MPIDQAIEERIQFIGRELFGRLKTKNLNLFTPAWLDEKLMDFTMSEEALKIQLFRFIDCLPVLKDPEVIALHLREYLNEARTQLPWWIRFGIRFLPTKGQLSSWLASIARWNAEHMARRFIAGSNVEEALQSIQRMRSQSLAFTIDLLGEATITESEADGVQNQYLNLLYGLSQEINNSKEIPLIDRGSTDAIPRVNVSVKLSALNSQFDPLDPEGTSKTVRKRLRPILSLAKELGAFVNFDMEQYAFKDTTLRIFREILEEDEFRHWPHAGIAIQTYLRDTLNDLKGLQKWVEKRGTPISIRLVKGAYWDYETVISAQHDWPVPVFTEKWQSDNNYEICSDFLMQHYQQLRPAFGTHNFRSMAVAIALAEKYQIPKLDWEFQMLYGMADEIKEVLTTLGHRVRIYTPYGQLLPGMAYLVRRLLENTSNESFLRASFREHLSEDLLLMHPTFKAPPHNANSSMSPHSNGAGNIRANDNHQKNKEEIIFKNEALSDFSLEANRQSISAALEKVKSQLGKTYPLNIDGKEIVSNQFLESVNPSRKKEIIGKVACAQPTHVELAIQTAKQKFRDWREVPVTTRANYLYRLADEMAKRKFELSAWQILECGKPWREADADVAEAIDFCRFYANEMIRLATAPHIRNVPGEENRTFYDARGVCVVIAPWNFPLAILTGMTTAALVAGNPVIMKPAEQSSVMAAKLMSLFEDIDFPKGVVQFLPGIGEEIGPVLVNHPDVAVIAFTGSLPVGLSIYEKAGHTPSHQHHVKKVIAELGGKNAIIVDQDADLDEAVKGVVDSAFGYQGQKCSAASRVIILEPIYEAFLHRLIEATKSLTIAAADSPSCSIGPVIDQEAQNRILKMIEIGKQEAKLIYHYEIGQSAEEGFFVGPHIFVDVDPKSIIAQNEIFGPVLAIMKAKTLEEALQIANGTAFALTGGIFSRSPENIQTARKEFRVGNLYINRKITGALVDRQPFGGFKLSGIGSKAGGPDYLLQFLLPRTITENSMRRGFAPPQE